MIAYAIISYLLRNAFFTLESVDLAVARSIALERISFPTIYLFLHSSNSDSLTKYFRGEPSIVIGHNADFNLCGRPFPSPNAP